MSSEGERDRDTAEEVLGMGRSGGSKTRSVIGSLGRRRGTGEARRGRLGS